MTPADYLGTTAEAPTMHEWARAQGWRQGRPRAFGRSLAWLEAIPGYLRWVRPRRERWERRITYWHTPAGRALIAQLRRLDDHTRHDLELLSSMHGIDVEITPPPFRDPRGSVIVIVRCSRPLATARALILVYSYMGATR